jgi:hypothetical protein
VYGVRNDRLPVVEYKVVVNVTVSEYVPVAIELVLSSVSLKILGKAEKVAHAALPFESVTAGTVMIFTVE